VQGDAGARDVVARHLHEATFVDFADARAQRDVDTWEEFEEVRAAAEGKSG
jgi:CTP:molybdopterin cytidylyltransferase MocA